MMSINIEKIKIVCFINVQRDCKFESLLQLVDLEYSALFGKFIDDYIYTLSMTEGVHDNLKESEVLKLSSTGVEDRESDDWKLALISDDCTSDNAIEIMTRYHLFSPYTLVLYHQKPQGLVDNLNLWDQCFAKGLGMHELFPQAVYPYIIPVIESILTKKTIAFPGHFENLARAIMLSDVNFINLRTCIMQEDTANINPQKREIYEELIVEA